MKHNRMYQVWLDRVLDDSISEGHIQQFKNAVWPRASDGPHSDGGRKMNMTREEAAAIVAAFRRRVAKDGGPLVEGGQAEKGRQYLQRHAKRLGLPTDINYLEITHFRLAGVHVVDQNQWRMTTAPVYEAYWPDGRVLRYWVGPWTARTYGRSHIPAGAFKFKEAKAA